VPYTIVHATQFFEFLQSIADAASDGETIRLAPVNIQPMAADDVAVAVGRIAVDRALSTTVEIAGPEVFRLDDLVRRRLRAHGDRREVVADVHAPYFGAELGEDTLVPGAAAELGTTTFAEWLVTSSAPPVGRR
jgi:hypothetical protein